MQAFKPVGKPSEERTASHCLLPEVLVGFGGNIKGLLYQLNGHLVISGNKLVVAVVIDRCGDYMLAQCGHSKRVAEKE